MTPIAATQVAQFRARWRRSQLAETDASDRASAARYRGLEDFRIVSIVVAELELRNVQRQILGADLMERADNTALEDRPEALNRIRVHSADNVLAAFMVHALVLRVVAHSFEDEGFVSRQQANLVRHHFAHECLRVLFGHPAENASDNVTLALDSADDRGLAGPSAPTTAAPLAPVAIVVLAAVPCVIDLDNAHQLAELLVLQSGADAVAHVPSGFVGTETHIAVDLPRANAFLASEHQMDDFEPVPQIDVRVLENGADKVREPISAPLPAVRALPFPLHSFERINPIAATARAMDALGPAVADQVGIAGILVGKHRLELGDGHLDDLPWLLRSGHDGSPDLREAA